jgi:drug/metabolite transporter (DMT)-like permease
MLASAMFVNPEGPPAGAILGVAAAIGLVVGFIWLRRISSLGEDADRSFSRLSRQRGGGSRLPDVPDIREVPTLGWLVTRAAIMIGVGAIVFAALGPLVMRRWTPAWDGGAIAALVWLAAIVAATVGTAWMIRIAVRTPEDGAPPWRFRR